jgi:hypothetical protein
VIIRSVDLQSFALVSVDDSCDVIVKFRVEFSGDCWLAVASAKNDVIRQVGECARHCFRRSMQMQCRPSGASNHFSRIHRAHARC